MNRLAFLTVASAAALGLSACDDTDDNITAIQDTPALSVGDLGVSTTVDLNEEQQARYDATDWDAAGAEYDTNYEAMMAESGGATTTMPPRERLDFAYLDRNDDGQLSLAEYAIWANPNTPNQTRPYLLPEQINDAARTFVYFDQDGDGYLSESEFQIALESVGSS